MKREVLLRFRVKAYYITFRDDKTILDVGDELGGK